MSGFIIVVNKIKFDLIQIQYSQACIIYSFDYQSPYDSKIKITTQINKINFINIIYHMAFVFQTERNLNQVSKLVNPTGPGQYFKQQNQGSPSHGCAPFQSTSKRKTLFQIKDAIQPGPGQYQIRTNIIQPNIKTVSNSQSIIVKINSTGTSQFKSARQRFGSDQTFVPGPGNYKIPNVFNKKRSSSPNSLNKSLNIQKKLKQLTRSLKNYPAIPQRTRGLTDMKKQEEPADQQKRGPACYDPKKKFSLNSTGTVWGKDKTRRFSADKFNQVGPGKYHIDLSYLKQQQKINQPSGNFKSATVRTFFDSLYYRTNKNQTARQRDGQNFKTKDPSPGQYQVNKSSFNVKEKPFSFQFFGSTVQRFPQDDIPFQKAKSKTFYNIGSQIGRNRSFNRGNHGFNSQSQRQTEFLSVKTKQKIPGPGHYKQKIVVQKKLKGNNVQKFGTTTQRPFYKKPQFDQVGPGKYGGNQNEEELIKTKFGQVKQISANFRSATGRNCFGTVKNDVPLAQYDVSQYDISKKVEKQKNFLQNLKKIQVQKAPFESTHTRFPHYQKKETSQKKSVADFNKQHQLKIKQQTQKARNQIIQFNRTQLKQKQANGYFNKEDRFKDHRKGGPGVGAYRVYTGFQMKSYNVKYQKDKK